MSATLVGERGGPLRVLVTGGAGGIGQAIARRMLAEGACLVLADIDTEALASVTGELAKEFGRDAVRSALCDVTSEASVIAAFGTATCEPLTARRTTGAGPSVPFTKLIEMRPSDSVRICEGTVNPTTS